MDKVVQGVCFKREEQGAYNGMLWSDVCKRMLEEEEKVIGRFRANS